MSLRRPHPLIRLALFGALYLCGWSGLQGVALGLYLAFESSSAAVVAELGAGRLPPELLILGAWLGLLAAAWLAALFHA